MIFRALCDIGCVAMVEKGKAKQLQGQDVDTFDLDWLQFKPVTSFKYMGKLQIEIDRLKKVNKNIRISQLF